MRKWNEIPCDAQGLVLWKQAVREILLVVIMFIFIRNVILVEDAR